MSAPGLDELLLPTSLESLRGQGAQRFDPVGFHYLEVLAKRLDAQQGELRRILQGKLNVALAAYSERVRLLPQKAAAQEVTRSVGQRSDVGRIANKDAAKALHTAGFTSLAELNRYIQSRTQTSVERGIDGEGQGGGEMKSVRHFKQAWSRICAEDQVEQAVEQGPENAGPLNSHMLVLRSLTLMRQLSPDYLQRFLSHVDSLLWLDQVSQKPTPAQAKPVLRSRLKK